MPVFNNLFALYQNLAVYIQAIVKLLQHSHDFFTSDNKLKSSVCISSVSNRERLRGRSVSALCFSLATEESREG